MPTIDVTGVLSSLGIANQVITAVRRKEVVDVHGRSVITTEQITGRGAIQPLGDNSMLREECFTTQKSGISVWSTTRLRGASKDPVTGDMYQPDVVVYGGNYYEVRNVDDWTPFGAGYVKVDCIEIDYQDVAPS